MKTGMNLGQMMKAIVPSDRVVVINAAGQVIYRGFAANFEHTGISDGRPVKSFGLGMETYRKTETMFDWKNVRELPRQVPVEQMEEYSTKDLSHIIYTRIILEN